MPPRPRGRGRSRSRAKRASEWNASKVGGVALLALAALAVAAMLLLRPDAVARDEETMCPESGPSRITAILVDTTDRVASVSRADILGRLDDLVENSETDEMIVAYESQPISEAVGSGPLEALLTVCNPGDPDEASELTRSPALIRRRLEERYRRPLERVFQDLLDRLQAPETPLMENVQAIAVTQFSRNRYDGLSKRLVLVSDLLQHSDNLSFYGGLPDYASFSRSPGADALRTDLNGVEAEILLIQREVHESLGGARRVIAFWERWMADQGGQITRVRRIAAVN